MIVHGGLERAASTFLQRRVFPNLTVYRYSKECSPIGLHLGYGDLSHISSRWIDIAKKIDDRTVLSAEGLICKRRAHGEGDVRDPLLAVMNLRDLVGPFSLLLVLRRQDTAIESMIRYKQRYLADPDTYLVDYPLRKSPVTGFWNYTSLTGRLLESYSYYKALSGVAGILGRDRIKVVLFEDLLNDPEKFYADLSAILKEDIGAIARDAPAENKTSRKYDDLPEDYVPMSHLVRRMNNLSGNRLEKLLPKRKRALSRDFAAEIMTIFQEENRKLEELLGIDLKKYGYY